MHKVDLLHEAADGSMRWGIGEEDVGEDVEEMEEASGRSGQDLLFIYNPPCSFLPRRAMARGMQSEVEVELAETETALQTFLQAARNRLERACKRGWDEATPHLESPWGWGKSRIRHGNRIKLAKSTSTCRWSATSIIDTTTVDGLSTAKLPLARVNAEHGAHACFREATLNTPPIGSICHVRYR